LKANSQIRTKDSWNDRLRFNPTLSDRSSGGNYNSEDPFGQSEPTLDRNGFVLILSSMDSRSLQKFPFAAGLIGCLIGILAVQGTMQGFVLCRGSDGHIAIEASRGTEGSCEPQSVLQTGQETLGKWLSSSLDFASHCGPCRDVSLAHTDFFYARSVFVQSQVGQKMFAELPAVPVLASSFGIPPDRRTDSHRLPATLSTPLHLRSTLLLI